MKVLIVTVGLLSLVAMIHCQGLTPEEIACLQDTSTEAYMRVNSTCSPMERMEVVTLSFDASFCDSGACSTAIRERIDGCLGNFFEICE